MVTHTHHPLLEEQKIYRKEVAKLEGREYYNFINSLRSSATKKTYSYSLLRYMKFLQIDNPSELITSMDSGNVKTIESRLVDYIVYLREHVAYGTRVGIISAIITFYMMNDILVNKRKLYRYLGEERRAHQDRAYTTEEIAAIISHSDIRLKAIVLLLASAGMRVGSLSELRLFHLIPVSDLGSDFYRITIYYNAKEEYFTFCTPEARKAIDEYLSYRQRSGEILNPKSPLFREEFDRKDSLMVAHPRKLNTGTLANIMSSILVKSGIRQVENQLHLEGRGKIRKDVYRFHGLRKFFNTNLVRANIHPTIKEMLMGHSIRFDKPYLKLTPGEICLEYVKAINLLTIDETNRLRKQLQEVTMKVDRLDEIEEKMKRLDKMLGLS